MSNYADQFTKDEQVKCRKMPVMPKSNASIFRMALHAGEAAAARAAIVARLRDKAGPSPLLPGFRVFSV